MAGNRNGATRLDSATRVPLYQQIVVILRNRIESGALAPGALAPSEAMLGAEFGVSRITARRALNELAALGLVTRERGRGTRVAAVERPAPLTTSLEGLFENVGRIGRATSVEVLDFRYLGATPEVARALGVEEGARVQRAVRVRRLGDAPMSYLVTVVPEAVGRLIEGEDMSRTPLLLLLEAAGVRVASARQRISATLADAEVAAALGVAAGAPLIEVTRLVSDADDRPVELIRILYRPELYCFEMTMRRVADGAAPRWSQVTPAEI